MNMLKLVVIIGVLIECHALQERIVSGNEAKEGEIKYIVSMQRYGKHFCGGSILDETHILTAAHCVYGTRPNFNIQYGVIDLQNEENKINVIKLVWHEGYVPGRGYHNDLAILTLESPIQWNDNVEPTKLSEKNAPTPEEAPAILAGWGLERSGGSIQHILQRVDLKIYSDDECEAKHKPSSNRLYHVCAGDPNSDKGQCTADSGGPLFANGVQVGVVSWSKKPCSLRGFPGVFVKVSNYIDWIQKHM